MPKNNLIPILLGTLFLLSCTGANSVYGQVVTLPDIDIQGNILKVHEVDCAQR